MADDLDELLLEYLPRLKQYAEQDVKEHGLVIAWSAEKKDYEAVWVEGDESQVNIQLEGALIVAHTHPSSNLLRGRNHPPSGEDYQTDLRSYMFFGYDAPHNYVVTAEGVWRMLGPTPSLMSYIEDLARAKEDRQIEDILAIVESNTRVDGAEFLNGEISLNKYLHNVYHVLSPDEPLGFYVNYIPYSDLPAIAA